MKFLQGQWDRGIQNVWDFSVYIIIFIFFFTHMNNTTVNTNEIKILSMKELAPHVPEFYMSNIGNFTCEGFVSNRIHNTTVSCTCRWDSSKILPWWHWAVPEKNCTTPVEDINFYDVDPLGFPVNSNVQWPPWNFPFFCIDALEIHVFSLIFGLPVIPITFTLHP